MNNSPGILPFKLGTARLIPSKHIFLHEINTKDLESSIDNLISEYHNLNSSISKSKPSFKINFVNTYQHLEPLIREVSLKFKNINVNFHSRRKRGLINVGGTVQKFLFGTLNAEDGERYDKALLTLKQNQQKVVSEVNSQISLSKQLIERYTKDIERITSNQKKISEFIKGRWPNIDNISDQFYKLSSYSTLIQQMFINAQIILTFLDNIENSITFAKLNTIHPDILTSENLRDLIGNLKSHYNENEILKLDIHSWYSLIKTQCYFRQNRIIFAIEVPIANPKPFQYFHLYPLPTIDHKIIIPIKPFLALDENQFQYMAYPCSKVEDTFICNQEEIRYNIKEDCVASIIQDRTTHCTQTSIEPPKRIFNRINDEYLVVITNEEIKLKTKCPDEGYVTTQGSALLKIPVNCSIEYEDLKFGISKINSFGKPLILPKLDRQLTKVKTENHPPLRIDHIPLEEIHSLKRQIQATNQLSIEDLDNHRQSWITWLTLCLILIIIIFFSVPRIKRWKTKLQPKVEININKEEKPRENPTPSVFFQPEA